METAWDACYLRHFQSYLGKPYDVQAYRLDADTPPLRVATYDQAYPKYRVYASVGMTAYAAAVRETAEVILLADAGWKDVPFLFVNALFYVAREQIPLASRFAIGGVAALKPDFADRFDKAAIFFTVADGFPEGFEQVACDDQIGLVFQGLFISEAEHDFLRRRGPQELERRLRAQDEDPCSLFRPSFL
jgi:hypothetical protein